MTSSSIKTSSLTRRDGLIALGFAAAAIGVTFDAWADIYRLGTFREELGYVLLAPFVILWIAWERRERLTGVSVRGNWAGLVVLAFGWLALRHGYWHDPVIWRAGAVVMLAGALLSAIGSKAALRLWPAFLGMLFLIPVSPDGRYQIALPLQTATAAATQTACDLIGMDIARSGNLLSTNGTDVTIAEACNGLRMVFTLVLVCYAAAFTGTSRPWLSWPLVLVSPVVAVIANVLRLVPTMWVFGHFDHDTAETFHDAAGWVMTLLAFAVLMSGLRAVEWFLRPVAASPAASDPSENGNAGVAATSLAGAVS